MTEHSPHSKSLTRLARNSLWSGFGLYAGLAFVPLTSVILTRFLGADGYGIYSLVQSWAGFAAGLCSLGLYGASLRLIPMYVAKREFGKVKGCLIHTTWIVGVLALCVSLAVALFPDEFCSLFVRKPDSMTWESFREKVVPVFQFYSVSILLTALYQSFLSGLAGLQAFRYKVIANDLISPVAKTLALVILLWIGFGVTGALAANIIQDVTILLLSGWFLTKTFPEVKERTVKAIFETGRTIKFAVALFLDSLLYRYTFQLDVLFLGYFGQLSGVGIYTVAQNLQRLIHMPGYSILTSFGPMCGELYAKGDLEGLEKTYKTATKWSCTFSFPLFTMYVLFAEPILQIFGHEFVAGQTALIVLASGSLVADSLGLSGSALVSTGRAKLNLVGSVVSATTSIVLFIILIPRYGILGAAIARSVAFLVINAIRIIQVKVVYNIHPFKRALLKPLGACVSAASVVRVSSFFLPIPDGGGFWMVFIAYLVIFSGVYVCVLWLLKFDDEDQMVWEILKRRVFLQRKSRT